MQLGLPANFVVGDARSLPFKQGCFDNVYSYSVLQHFAEPEAMVAFREAGRVLRPGGRARIQMANRFGLRSWYQLARRGFVSPTGFEVRYWSPGDLDMMATESIGETDIVADCFLGLGLQRSDYDFMGSTGKFAIIVSDLLVQLSTKIGFIKNFSDSIFLDSRKRI